MQCGQRSLFNMPAEKVRKWPLHTSRAPHELQSYCFRTGLAPLELQSSHGVAVYERFFAALALGEKKVLDLQLLLEGKERGPPPKTKKCLLEP